MCCIASFYRRHPAGLEYADHFSVDPGRLDLPGGGDQFLFAPWRRMGDGPVIGCTARGEAIADVRKYVALITIPGACTRRWVTRHRWITNRTLTKCAKLVNHYKTAK